jgi:glyoxylase-like metal-dependent hydrolase (beta-lactamase superfamily II)
MIEEIAPGFYRIEILLPDTVLKFVNSYVVKDNQRNLIIDTGMYNKECFNAMQVSLRMLDIDLEETDIFITHAHGDHIGLIYQLIGPATTVYINKLEAQIVYGLEGNTCISDIGAFVLMSGFPEKDPRKIFPVHAGRQHKSGIAPSFRFIEDGEIIKKSAYKFTCVQTPGHSKGHMCLYEPEKRILIAGDHILKDITPGIQGRLDNENPLKEYLSSLDKIHALDIDVVLPGHGNFFRNPGVRIQAIKEHHQKRNNKVLDILREGAKSIYEMASP